MKKLANVVRIAEGSTADEGLPDAKGLAPRHGWGAERSDPVAAGAAAGWCRGC